MTQTHTEVSDIYDTAINPEQPNDMLDDIYDEAMVQPVSFDTSVDPCWSVCSVCWSVLICV